MSQTTRCPACQTLFKVVPDQLRVSEGWVRCGQCSEIFDAALHVYLEPQIAGPAREIPHAVVAVEPVAREPAVLPESVAPPVLPEWAGIEDIQEKPFAHVTPPVEPVTEKRVAQEAFPAETSMAEGKGTQIQVPYQAAAVSFLKGTPQKSPWQKPSVRIALGLATLGLVATLALQVVVHERDRIAASMPDARSAMAGVCDVLRCKISPLRQIESVVIESSTFSKMQGDAYRLAFTVKNTSAMALAMPALELTLTDSQDQPALRRVFLPSDFGAAQKALAAGSEWAASAIVGVQPIAGTQPIAGYRVLAFYP